MHDKSGIYRITCLATGLNYVGSAVKLYHRWYNHKRTLGHGTSRCRRLQHAWTQYGESAFIFEIIEECPRDILSEREDWWIENSPSELNVMRKSGKRPDSETFAQSQRDAWKSPERRAKARKPGEFSHDADSKAKMSAAKKGKPSVKRKDFALCGNQLHTWVDGQKECGACVKAQQLRRYIKQYGHAPHEIARDYTVTPETRAKISETVRARGIVPKTQERADPTKCLKGLHAWVDGQKKCRECAADTYKAWALRTGRATGTGRWPRACLDENRGVKNASVFADYEEFKPETYAGCGVYQDPEATRYNTGFFDEDVRLAEGRAFALGFESVTYMSSLDHYRFERDAVRER